MKKISSATFRFSLCTYVSNLRFMYLYEMVQRLQRYDVGFQLVCTSCIFASSAVLHTRPEEGTTEFRNRRVVKLLLSEINDILARYLLSLVLIDTLYERHVRLMLQHFVLCEVFVGEKPPIQRYHFHLPPSFYRKDLHKK